MLQDWLTGVNHYNYSLTCSWFVSLQLRASVKKVKRLNVTLAEVKRFFFFTSVKKDFLFVFSFFFHVQQATSKLIITLNHGRRRRSGSRY